MNNKGWGFGFFVVYLCIFIFAIIVVSFLCAKNGMGPNSSIIMRNESINVEKYEDFENEVKEKSREYQLEFYPNIVNGTKIKIDIKRLDIKREILYKCTGYVLIEKNNNVYKYSPFLKCGDYITDGYRD